MYSWVIFSSVSFREDEPVRDKKKLSPTWPPGRPESGHRNIGFRPKRGGGHGYCRQDTVSAHILYLLFLFYAL